jgi:hypothetical protein
MIFHARRLARLRVNQLHVRDIYKSFFINDATAAIVLRIGALVFFTMPAPSTLTLPFVGDTSSTRRVCFYRVRR